MSNEISVEHLLLSGIKSNEQQKLAIIRLFLSLAHADGNLSENEISAIKSILKNLEIDCVDLTEELNDIQHDTITFLQSVRDIFSDEAKIYIIKQIIHFCFCDGTYSAFERLALFKIAKSLGNAGELVYQGEQAYIEQCANQMKQISQAYERSEDSEFDWSKAAMVGGLSVSGGLLVFVTGGLAAPAIGGLIGSQILGYSGAAAVSSGLAALGGGSLASGGLGVAGGTAVISSLFGLGGAAATARTTMNLCGDLEEYQLIRITPDRYACHSFICIHGFLQQGLNPQKEWLAITEYDQYSDIYSLSWESKTLQDLGKNLSLCAGKFAAAPFLAYVASSGLKSAGNLFALPATVLTLLSMIDNPWFVARNKAQKAGEQLGKDISKMKAPVSLLGYSLGSRVIAYALEYLQQNDQYGKVFNVFFMGGAIGQDHCIFTEGTINKIVANKIFNIYSSNDVILKYVYRAAELGNYPIGISALRSSQIIDVDASELVHGHLDYPQKLAQLMELCADHPRC